MTHSKNEYKIHWTKLKPTPDPKHGVPCPRSSHGLSILKGGKMLLLHGGEEVARTPLDSSQATWAAKLVERTWSWRCIRASPLSSTSSEGRGAVCPPARVAHAQASYNDDTVYIFGGRAGVQMEEAAMNDMWKLDCSGNDPGSFAWSKVEYDLTKGGAPPEARSFHKMLCVGTSLYVFGGCGGKGRLADLHRFDILNSTWHELPTSSLRGRGGPNFMTFDSDTQLGVVGGFCGEESNDGQLFDRTSETWGEQNAWSQKLLAGLRPRSVCISASYPSLGVSVIFGGEVDPSAKGHEGAGGFENDVVLLDEKTARYLCSNSAPPLADGDSGDDADADADADDVWPETRGWSDGASTDMADEGKLYVYGGLSGDDSNPKRLDDLWCLSIQKM